MTRARILILGGTGEGFSLAAHLDAVNDIDVVTSMAGRTPAPKVPRGAVRRGGFGGPEGLASYLKAERIAAVIDATHPFASRMSRNAAWAGETAGIPVVHVWRTGWERVKGDDWREVDGIEEAVALLPVGAGMTFLTTGKTQLHHFSGRDDVAFLARIVAPLKPAEDVGALPKRLTFIHDRGPFDMERERRVLLENTIEWIVSKNSGGNAAYPKIVAARELGIPVIMIKRPDGPDGVRVPDAAAALIWIDATLGTSVSCASTDEVMV